MKNKTRHTKLQKPKTQARQKPEFICVTILPQDGKEQAPEKIAVTIEPR